MTITNKYTEPNNSLAKFVEQMIKDGFVWMSNEKFTQTRLYNKFSGSYPANDFVPLQYARYCKLANVPKEDNISAYVKASLPLVTGTIFRPNGADIVHEYGSSWINTYRQRERQKSQYDISAFQQYLERLWPDELDRHTCVSWLAHMFQQPEKRPSWHLMLISDVGTGKGFLVNEILNKLLCGQSAVVSSYERVIGKFSNLLAHNMLVLLDDPKTKSEHTMTQLKSVLSEERAFVERKGMEGTMVKTYTRFILASNEARPLRLEDNERRWYVPRKLEHLIDKEETQKFIEKISAELEAPGFLDAVYDWFMEYDISEFNHKHVDQSDTLKGIIGLSGNLLDGVYDDFLESREVFSIAEVKSYFEREGFNVPTERAIGFALGDRGFESKPIKVDEVKRRYWLRKGLSTTEARQILEKNFRCASHVNAFNPF